jgi:hypothetical protein
VTPRRLIDNDRGYEPRLPMPHQMCGDARARTTHSGANHPSHLPPTATDGEKAGLAHLALAKNSKKIGAI